MTDPLTLFVVIRSHMSKYFWSRHFNYHAIVSVFRHHGWAFLTWIEAPVEPGPWVLQNMSGTGPPEDDPFDFLFKIILIGDSNVGKTCVVQRFQSGAFSDKHQNTIGVDFTVRSLNIDGKKVKVKKRRVWKSKWYKLKCSFSCHCCH